KRSFVFEVDGTYLDLRKFINLLELSDSFLTLEAVSLSERGRRSGSEAPPVQFAQPAAPGGGGRDARGSAGGGAAGSGAGSERHSALRLSTLFAKEGTDPFATPAAAARAGRNGG